MKKISKILLAIMLFVIPVLCAGCIKPYDKPELVTIEASQTAFLVPLIGDSSEQASFQSEELLAQAMVATKEVQIPHRWVQLGRREWFGEWRPSAKLIVVERKPVSRSWESGDTAADSANRAIFGETSDAIGVYVGMNCTAMIEEKDATKFLYRYNNTPLETIIDTDIKKMVEDEFNMATGVVTSSELHANKESIMKRVKTNVINHFKEYGITITVLGLKEGISFENPEIQAALDAKYASEQDLIIQQNKNAAAVAKAQADAESVIIAAKAEAEANRMLAESITPALIEWQKYQKWNGELPKITGETSTIVDMTE
jgi:hypothetical protein